MRRSFLKSAVLLVSVMAVAPSADARGFFMGGHGFGMMRGGGVMMMRPHGFPMMRRGFMPMQRGGYGGGGSPLQQLMQQLMQGQQGGAQQQYQQQQYQCDAAGNCYSYAPQYAPAQSDGGQQ